MAKTKPKKVIKNPHIRSGTILDILIQKAIYTRHCKSSIRACVPIES